MSELIVECRSTSLHRLCTKEKNTRETILQHIVIIEVR